MRRSLPLCLAIAVVLVGTLAGSATMTVAAQSPAADALVPPGLPTLEIRVTDDAITTPQRVTAGRYLATVEDDSGEDVDILLVHLAADVTLAEIEEGLGPGVGPLPSWFYRATMPGAPGSTPAGGRSQAVIDLTPGFYAAVEVANSDTGARFEVVPAAASPESASTPTATTAITLTEMAFGGLPAHAAAGPQVWKISNTGQQPHQLTLLKVPAGTTTAQVAALLSLPAGATPPPGVDTAAFVPAGGIGILSPGQTAWTLLDLAPGTYAALCHVPDQASGIPDALLGMLTVFTVGEGTTPVS